MKKCLAASLLALSASATAGEYTPFIAVDFATETDTLHNDYLSTSLAVGLKAPGQMEYAARIGVSEKESDTHTRNVETRVKKSFDVGLSVSPYVALRLGQRTGNRDKSSFTHWAADAGLRVPIANQLALDIGIRYRDAFRDTINYQSTRYHIAALYALDKTHVVGLRYNTSTSRNRPEEERDGWRVTYQRNF